MTEPVQKVHKARVGFDRLKHAFGYSMEGLKAAYQNEKAFKLEVWITAVLMPSAFWLGNSWIETALLTGSVIAVLAAELINSAIEAIVDRVSLDLHELSKRAKDMGSACVLLMVLLAAGVWAAALWSRFFAR